MQNYHAAVARQLCTRAATQFYNTQCHNSPNLLHQILPQCAANAAVAEHGHSLFRSHELGIPAQLRWQGRARPISEKYTPSLDPPPSASIQYKFAHNHTTTHQRGINVNLCHVLRFGSVPH
jgi:hypothetical protein